MKNQICLFTSLFLAFIGTSLNAELSFENLNLNSDSGLVFTAKAETPGYGQTRTGFAANIETSKIEAKTFFPEFAQWLPSKQAIQIQNRFGVYRLKVPSAKPELLSGFASFEEGAEVQTGKLFHVISSPDGEWIVFQRTTSPAFSELVLKPSDGGAEKIIAKNLELQLSSQSVLWSPESDLLVYEKNHALYYYSITQARASKSLDESFRKIGPGTLRSVRWSSSNELIYVYGNMVYQILGAELFTRSLYQDFLKIGRIIGRLPHEYDPNFDQFWLSADSRVLLLAKNDINFYFYPMHEESQIDGLAWEFPFLSIPRANTLRDVIWSSEGLVTLFFDALNSKGELRTLLYRFDTQATKPSFTYQESTLAQGGTLIGDKLIIRFQNGIKLYDYRTLKLEKEFEIPKPLWVFGETETRLLVIGDKYAERIDLGLGTRDLLFFSQADEIGYDKDSKAVALKAGNKGAYEANGRFLIKNDLNLINPQTANAKYRVYTEDLYSGPYQNTIMIRKVKEVGTKALFNATVSAYEAYPKLEEAIDFNYFSHGSRIRSRSISLTFNAIDSAEGLDQILDVLSYYNIRATFFVNGEFLRRYPAAAKKLANSGQEVGNLFYTWFNMADQKYKLDAEFLKLGLARNEDEYRDVTGKELSLIWRTPYNVVNKDILDASRDLKYTLVGADLDSLDSITRDQKATGLYKPASVIVEDILSKKKPGTIISMTIGKAYEATINSSGREDYLFQKLDVLINALIQKGYNIVPVSKLIESAR